MTTQTHTSGTRHYRPSEQEAAMFQDKIAGENLGRLTGGPVLTVTGTDRWQLWTITVVTGTEWKDVYAATRAVDGTA